MLIGSLNTAFLFYNLTDNNLANYHKGKTLKTLPHSMSQTNRKIRAEWSDFAVSIVINQNTES